MRLRIHRGTREIGGTCVELESGGKLRLLLDLGLPLDAPDLDTAPLPDIVGLKRTTPRCWASSCRTGHRDHWGLLPKVEQPVPLIMGRAAESIMRAAADFVPDGFAPNASAYLVDGVPLQLGPFTIIPWLVDHSGFDAYATEVTAGGRRLFYSGDLRAHGRKGKLFERLVARPPRDVDVMLMEGSSLGRLPDDGVFATEDDLEEDFVARFGETPGMALVACSAQNIDRVVTVYRAAKRMGRTLVVDAYAAEVLKATGHDSIPKPTQGWSNIAVFIPQRQRVMLKTRGIAPLVDSYRPFRIWPQQLAERAPGLVMLFRGWMLPELADNGALNGARLIWSQWDGYLQNGSGAMLRDECAARGIPSQTIHTSGHASPIDLKRLAAAIAPKKLVPIHTFESSRYPSLFENVVQSFRRGLAGRLRRAR